MPGNLSANNDVIFALEQVTLANEDKQEGNLGNLYPSIEYFYFDVYYSESNSSLSLVIPTDAVDCTPGGDISLSLPVLFVANNINQALMRLQVRVLIYTPSSCRKETNWQLNPGSVPIFQISFGKR